jgi:hypothetical protein
MAIPSISPTPLPPQRHSTLAERKPLNLIIDTQQTKPTKQTPPPPLRKTRSDSNWPPSSPLQTTPSPPTSLINYIVEETPIQQHQKDS